MKTKQTVPYPNYALNHLNQDLQNLVPRTLTTICLCTFWHFSENELTLLTDVGKTVFFLVRTYFSLFV